MSASRTVVGEPNKGTGEPGAVALARSAVDQGIELSLAARRLIEEYSDLAALQEARNYWLRRMPAMRRSWDDHRPVLVLRVLERAIAELQPLPDRHSREIRKRRWASI